MPITDASAKTGRKGRLVLKTDGLRSKTSALFDNLKEDRALRAEFIRDPAGAVTTRVLGRKLPGQQLSDANRVLFAMLANDRFRKWLDGYAVRKKGRKVSDQVFGKDFAKAVLKYGDSDLLLALLKHAADGFGIPGFPNAQQLVTGPDKSVATSPATPSTSDKSANSSQNFNNKQTGFQFGDGALVNPALFRAVTSQLITYAKTLKAQGKLADAARIIR